MSKTQIYKTVKKNALEEDVYILKPSGRFWVPDSWEYVRTQMIDKSKFEIKGVDDYTKHAFKKWCSQNGLKHGEGLAKLLESVGADREWPDDVLSAMFEADELELRRAAGHSLFFIGEVRGIRTATTSGWKTVLVRTSANDAEAAAMAREVERV